MRFCTPTQGAPRRGNQPSNPHRTPPRPSGSRREPAGTISRRPPYSVNAPAVHLRDNKRPFLLDRARPVFFSGKTEKKMGGALG